MTDQQKAAMQAALGVLERLHGGCTDSDDGTVEAITVWCPEVIEDLRAALAQCDDVMINGLTKAETCASASVAGLTLAQQEPDWKSRAEIAEQQVVSLSEELAHCKGLLRKQQQAEPVAWLKWEWNRTGTKSLVFDRPEELSLSENARGVVYDPLYTAPPPRKRLTSQQVADIVSEAARGAAMRRDGTTSERIVRLTERAHGIGDEHE